MFLVNFFRDYFILMFLILIFFLSFYSPSFQTRNSIKQSNKYKNDNYEITNATDGIFWFVQVTDTHLSKFKEEREQNFERLLGHFVEIINPKIVIHSGDITDGLSTDSIGLKSSPQKQEWTDYQDILTSHSMFNHTFWVDVVGNHDWSGVKNLDSNDDYFFSYSPTGDYLSQTQREKSFRL
ncbi:helicase related [Anaeramoeba ignava]|uniref:Helicase related n=1 Tax=Anaeramoeba ignava TaxID=1746090 RepID=A0A9Q0LUM2_ANAIG|nr:helicase related [Anaeramoeba ignava]